MGQKCSNKWHQHNLITEFAADRPVTYLYNTLHYYERQLRDRTNLKRKLVHAIMSSLKVATAECFLDAAVARSS